MFLQIAFPQCQVELSRPPRIPPPVLSGIQPPESAPQDLQSHPAATTGQPGKTDLQISTNVSGSSGEKPMALKRPDFFLNKTWGHKSQKSIFIPHKSPKSLFIPDVKPIRTPITDGRSLTAWISSIGR